MKSDVVSLEQRGKQIMLYRPYVTTVVEEEEEGQYAEDYRSSIRFSSRRRERYTHGLGLRGVQTAGSSGLYSKQHQRDARTKPSLSSLFTRSRESSNSKTFPARPSSALSSIPSLVHRSSSSSESSSSESSLGTPSRISFVMEDADESDEDITTYSANLARYKAERAERTAQLGLTVFDDDFEPSAIEVTRLEELQLREPESRRSSFLSMSRDNRASYWGGGSSPDIKSPKSPSIISKRTSTYSFSEGVGQEALREWWDSLGTESVPAHRPERKVFVNPEIDFSMAADVMDVMLNADYTRSLNSPYVGSRRSSRRAISTAVY